MNEPAAKVWEILNKFEDIIEGGYRTKRTQIRPAHGSPAPEKSASAKPSGGGKAEELRALEDEVRECTRCGLSSGRKNAVPGKGAENPMVMIIGEGPGAEEDQTGVPFVGRAGRYLDKWLDAIGLSRETDTYIGNIVKCRPPGNRDPRPEESSACLPFLIRQIELLRPTAILTVGRIASQILLETSRGIGATRGRVYQFHDIPLVATYHPSGVLRNPEYRAPVWEDLKLLKTLLETT